MAQKKSYGAGPLVIIGLLIFGMVMIGRSDISEDDILSKSDIPTNRELDLFKQGLETIPEIKGHLVFSRATKVSGATCSETADVSKAYSPSSETTKRYCITNNNHIGVVVQLFDITYGPWNPLGDLILNKGERKCYDVDYGHNYWVQMYHCDDIEVTSCSDSDGPDIYTFGEVTVIRDFKKSAWYDQCSTGGILQERVCDKDNTVQTKSIDCSPGECKNGVCQDKKPECFSKASKSCYGGHVYWHDSCGSREDVAEYCDPRADICEGSSCEKINICQSNFDLKCHENNVWNYDSCGNRETAHKTCNVITEECISGECIPSGKKELVCCDSITIGSKPFWMGKKDCGEQGASILSKYDTETKCKNAPREAYEVCCKISDSGKTDVITKPIDCATPQSFDVCEKKEMVPPIEEPEKIQEENILDLSSNICCIDQSNGFIWWKTREECIQNSWLETDIKEQLCNGVADSVKIYNADHSLDIFFILDPRGDVMTKSSPLFLDPGQETVIEVNMGTATGEYFGNPNVDCKNLASVLFNEKYFKIDTIPVWDRAVDPRLSPHIEANSLIISKEFPKIIPRKLESIFFKIRRTNEKFDQNFFVLPELWIFDCNIFIDRNGKQFIDTYSREVKDYLGIALQNMPIYVLPSEIRDR